MHPRIVGLTQDGALLTLRNDAFAVSRREGSFRPGRGFQSC